MPKHKLTPAEPQKKKIVTIRLPVELEMDFMQRVIVDGYGMKGKSKWVAEAVRYLMKLEDFAEYVEYAAESNDFSGRNLQENEGETEKKAAKTSLHSFYLEQDLLLSLRDAVINVRREHPHLEGIQSLIIRSSIIQRLFREKSVYRDSESNVT